MENKDIVDKITVINSAGTPRWKCEIIGVVAKNIMKRQIAIEVKVKKSSK